MGKNYIPVLSAPIKLYKINLSINHLVSNMRILFAKPSHQRVGQNEGLRKRKGRPLEQWPFLSSLLLGLHVSFKQHLDYIIHNTKHYKKRLQLLGRVFYTNVTPPLAGNVRYIN